MIRKEIIKIMYSNHQIVAVTIHVYQDKKKNAYLEKRKLDQVLTLCDDHKLYLGQGDTPNGYIKWYQMLLLLYRQLIHHIYIHIQGVSENSISFRNLITWPIPIQMISNFNSMCRNNSKFCLMFERLFFLSEWHLFGGKEKDIEH